MNISPLNFKNVLTVELIITLQANLVSGWEETDRQPGRP